MSKVSLDKSWKYEFIEKTNNNQILVSAMNHGSSLFQQKAIQELEKQLPICNHVKFRGLAEAIEIIKNLKA